jgi:pyruvate decarboxylase
MNHQRAVSPKPLDQAGVRTIVMGILLAGYARACGVGAAVVTFSVGGLSAINAVAEAYAENLPVILVSGAPNTNDRATEHLI